MALELKKGGKLNLKKEAQIKIVRLGLGWAFKPGLDADLDASVVLLGSDNKMWAEDSIVYYNKLKSSDGAITHQGDIRGEDAGGDDGDDENIVIDLTKVSANTKTILAVVTSYSETEPIIFGRIDCATVNLYDETDSNNVKLLATFDLTEDKSNYTSLEMAKLVRHEDSWEFSIIGEGVGMSSNGLQDIINRYSI